MFTARRQFFRFTLLTAGLLSSGLVMANATLDPLLAKELRKARPSQDLQVIVSFKQSGPVSPQQIAALKTLGIKSGVYMNRLPIMGVLATPTQVRQLAQRKDVASVYYNARLRYMNLEQRQMSGAARVSTSPADFGRAIPFSGKGVTVVVNDSGLDTTHPDLPMGSKVQDNVFAAQNILKNASDGIVPYTAVRGLPNTDLGSGHGQHCAGTVGGTGAASNGRFRGAAPGADIVGYGSGGVLLILDAVGGLDFALTNQFAYRNPIRVVSNSWGTSGPFDETNPVNIASYELAKSGIVSVFAAGNDGPGENTHNPYAQAPWVISVGAGEKDGVLTGFSSRGNRGESRTFTMPDGREWTYKNEPTIVATGVDIISTRTLTGGVLATSAPQDANLGPGLAAYYSHLSGTSMATPHVAGVTALLLEANPKLTPAQVKTIFQKTATNMSGRRSFEVGAGHLNAYAAVAMAQAMGQNRNLAFGSTLKTNRSFKTLTSAGSSVDLMNKTELVTPGIVSANEFPFLVNESDKLIELTGKIDTYSAANGTGTSYVRAVLIDPKGTVYRSTTSTIPGAFLLGPVTQVTVSGADKIIPGEWKLRIDGSQTNGQSVFTPEEMILSAFGRAAGAASGPSDVVNLPEAQRAILGAALAAELIDADSDGQFNPGREITRFDLAQSLVYGANIRQSLPLRVTTSKFGSELPTSDPMYGFAEAVTTRGAVLRDLTYTQQPVMKLRDGKFAGGAKANRAEVAYALVQALGDQAVTDAVVLGTNGQITTANGKVVADSGQIPADLRKHVKRALDLGFLSLSESNGMFSFNPGASVTKADFAAALLKYSTEYRKVED